MKIIIIWIILILIISYCSFVVLFRIKLNKLENILKNLFKIRNYKIVSLYYASQNFLNKHNEIFEEYINLKQKDFSENSLNFNFENKLNTYKKIHNELNFIFKICETNWKLKMDEKYNYIKESILDESYKIWEKYDFYKSIIKKYRKHHKISKIFIIWLFMR